MVYDSFQVMPYACLNKEAIPDNAKSEGFKVGNNSTLLQIVGHHPTARAKRTRSNSFILALPEASFDVRCHF
jgi:hypothetical protein